MAYQPGVPTGTVPLNQDYKNLQENFTQIDSQWKVDHVPLTNTSGVPPAGDNGYHTFVHLVPFSTTVTNPPNNQPVTAPAATTGFGQLFGAQINDGINTDQALYYLTGGGRLSQLTRNIQPVASNTAGVSFLPGGLLIQWGTMSMNTLTNFPQAFKAGTTPVLTYGVFSGGLVPIIATLTATQFQVNGSGLTGTWMAIGQ